MSAKLPDDFVCRFLFESLDVRGAFTRLTPAWQAMQQGRGYAPAAAMLLGEMTAVTVLIACQLKQEARMTFQLKSNGPVSLLVVDCDEQLRLRGMLRAQPGAELSAEEKMPVPALLGDGQLLLTLDAASSREPYQSIVPLEGDSIAEVFEHYLTQSEQQQTRLFLASTSTACAGLFLQKLPVSSPTADDDGWNRVTRLAATVRPDELTALPPEALLKRLFAEEDMRLFAPQPLTYHCPYDKAKVEAMLRALGRDEVLRLVEAEGEIQVHDEICNHHYRFDRDEALALFDAPLKTMH